MPGRETIEYRNCHSSRDEGLPLGNGHFAGMVFHPPGRLVLMPLYPIGEVSKRSDPDTQALWLRTWRNARKRQAIGTHNFGWLAAASARLGRGDEAVATLYELGIDHQMRSNGMLAEETERWIQNCLVTVEPVHSPPLAEANGALVAAINEMLLQSFGGVVEVFPAVPMSWQDVAFEGFLAEGGFEVSARREHGQTAEMSVLSRLGGRLTLVSPFPKEQLCVLKEGQPVAVEADDQGLLHLDTEIGRSYRITSVEKGERKPAAPDTDAAGSQVLVRRTESRRRAFLGKDENTDLVRSLDDFTHDFYAGDQIVSRMTVYKFDFTGSVELLAKDYREILEPQMHGVGKKGPDFRRVTVESPYSPEVGFGWESLDDLTYVDRGQPDPLCRDFIGGTRPNAFVVDLVAGRYRILVLSGDAMASNDTRISTQLPGSECTVLASKRPGRFATESFAIELSEDRFLRLEVDFPRPGDQWKLNALLINKVP